MAYDKELAHRIREQVGDEHRVTEKAMFGGLAFLLNGGRIEGIAPAGGFTHPDSAAWAIEHEAGKVDSQEKLSCSSNAERRHLFVIPYPLAVDACLSVRHRRIGRVPALRAPITTAWVWDGDSPYVFVATPPSPGEDCELPSHLLAEPEMWVD
jgi:hypothetical protein